MFKLTGFLLIMVSCILLWGRATMKDYQTYLLLNDAKNISTQLEILSGLNDTYSNIFSRMDLSSTAYFKQFEFIDREAFIAQLQENQNFDSYYLNQVCQFISELGNKSRQAEAQYIETCCTLFYENAIVFKQRYLANQKLHLLCGISTGIIISLIII